MKSPPFRQSASVLLAVVVAACAADSPVMENMMVVPGYFDTLDCRELLNQFRAASQRINELTLLRTKAGGQTGGAVANALAYDTEFARTQATKKYAESAAKQKGCDLGKKPDEPPPQAKSKPARPQGAMPH